MIKTEHREVKSEDGIGIHYWINWNSHTQKSVVLMHPGASLNHTSLEVLAEGLNTKGYPTIVFDQRGIGYSKAPAKREFYSLERHSQDLQAIIEKEELEKPILLTHSFGFHPAVDYVSRTDNAGKIIGICSSHNFAETIDPLLLKTNGHETLAKTLAPLFGIVREVLTLNDHFGWAVNSFIGAPNKYSNQRLEGKSVFEMWLAMQNASLHEINVHYIHGKELMKWDITNQLGKVKLPVHLIYGKNDFIVSPPAGNMIKQRLPEKTEYRIDFVENAGHELPVICPKEVLKYIN